MIRVRLLAAHCVLLVLSRLTVGLKMYNPENLGRPGPFIGWGREAGEGSLSADQCSEGCEGGRSGPVSDVIPWDKDSTPLVPSAPCADSMGPLLSCGHPNRAGQGCFPELHAAVRRCASARVLSVFSAV